MPDERDFIRRSSEMMAFYGQGDYASALAMTERLAAEFPEEVARIAYWRICLLTRLQKTEAALGAFTGALEAGLWWSVSMLGSDPDLEPLWGLPEYKRMASICARRQEAAQMEVKSLLVVREPAKAVKPYPVLISLHGQAGTAAATLDRWQEACPLGWLVAAIQSSQLAWPDAYTWDDHEKAEKEVVDQFRMLCEQVPVDRSRVIVGGFSQGAALAVGLVLTGSLPARGFLSVAPGSIEPKLLTGWVEAEHPHPVRGYLVAGGHDPRYEFFKQLRTTLVDHGVPCEMEDHPDLAHEYPPHFKRSLKKAFRFLMS